tara:strand:- start:1083 stop:3062 length:1980 start_codon:yes stop_codon:yes gene_type:complete
MSTDANFVIKKGLNVQDGDISIKGSNKELRFYEGSNYVGFEAPALSADKIWVLPAADGSTGQALKTDGSGNLGWVSISSVSALDDLSDAITLSSRNLGLGTNAGVAWVSGANQNVAVGEDSGKAITTGDGNISVGAFSLQTATTSGYNTAIGDQAASSATGWRNVMVGASSGQNITTSDSVFVGYQAGQAVTSGLYNVALGSGALNDVTTGNRNIGIGYGAGDGYDAESDNIAIGYDALGGAINGGEYNVAIGNYAGDAVTTGDGHVLIGHQAGTTMSTAQKCVYIGYQAGKDTTSAQENVGIGDQALENNTDGGANTAVGHYAMKDTDSGYNNTAVGSFALYSNTGGQNNTGVGVDSLRVVDGGHKNIGIGSTAGNNITSGSYNVVIGAADVPSATGNSQLSISDGDGGVTWITGTSDGSVQIGTGTQPITAGQLTVVQEDNEAAHTLLLMDNEDDATRGPILTMYRNTASPAADDRLGSIRFNGEDAGGYARDYAKIEGKSVAVGAGSHTGALIFSTTIGASITDIITMDGTTGGAYGGIVYTETGIKTLSNSVSATSTANDGYITLLAVPHATFKAVKASIHITDSSSNEVQTMDLICHYDGSAANYTTYGIIYDGDAPIGDVEVDINSSNIRIRFQNTQGSTVNLAGSIHAVCHP